MLQRNLCTLHISIKLHILQYYDTVLPGVEMQVKNENIKKINHKAISLRLHDHAS